MIPKPRLAFLVASSLVASVLVVGFMMLAAMPTGLPAAHLLDGTHYGPARDAVRAAATASDG
jgi:hypothetical protein